MPKGLKKQMLLHISRQKCVRSVHSGRTVVYYTYDPISQPGDARFNQVAISVKRLKRLLEKRRRLGAFWAPARLFSPWRLKAATGLESIHENLCLRNHAREEAENY